jgi:hypothetical protein
MTTPLAGSVSGLLRQLEELLQQLADAEYQRPIAVLSNASLGQHTRHILEFFNELQSGYAAGVVNYDKRKRDHCIETSRLFALATIWEIERRLDRPDKKMTLEVEAVNVATTYFRELVYTLEHTVHHMALLRIGVQCISGPALSESFGVAASTLKHRRVCAR